MARKPGRYAFAFIFFTVLIEMIGLGIIIPVLPSLIQEVAGLEIGEAARIGGWLTFVFAGAQFVSAPLVGGLSDRYGRRPILIASLAGYAVDYLIMGLAPVLAVLFVGRLVAGTFAATVSTAYAYVADVTPASERGGRYGLLGAAFGLGFIIGPAIGGFVGEALGPRAPFLVASALAGANAVYGLLVLPETLTDDRRRAFDWRRANPLGGLLSVGRTGAVGGVLLSLFITQTAFAALPATWSFFAIARFGWTSGEIGLSLAYVGLGAAVVQGGLAGPAIKAFGERAAAVVGFIATIAAFAAYAFAPNPIVLYAGLTVGTLSGFIMPSVQVLMSAATPPDSQGELQGAVSSALALTMIIGPVVFTQIFAAFTEPDPVRDFPGAAYLVGSIVNLAALVVFLAATRKLHSTGARPNANVFAEVAGSDE